MALHLTSCERAEPNGEHPPPEVSGYDCYAASFEYEQRTGLTIETPPSGKAWLDWAETKGLAAWLAALVLRHSE